MTLEAFIKKNRLRRKRDDDDTTIVPGKNGHIFDYGDGRLGVLIMPKAVHPRIWNKARAAFEKLGMTVTLDCDGEGITTFNPESAEQCQAAIKHAGISARRVATPSQLAALAGYRGDKSPQNQIHHAEVPPKILRTILGPGTPHLSGGLEALKGPLDSPNIESTEQAIQGS
jgi:hypothetical protein